MIEKPGWYNGMIATRKSKCKRSVVEMPVRVRLRGTKKYQDPLFDYSTAKAAWGNSGCLTKPTAHWWFIRAGRDA